MSSNKGSLPFQVLTCPVCGKEFIKPAEPLYKARTADKIPGTSRTSDKTLIFCRYNCWVKWLKDHGRW